MPNFELSSDDVSALMALLPASAIGPRAELSFADGVLTVSDELAAHVQAITTTKDWRQRGQQQQIAPRIKAECQRRIYALASPNTQLNLTAAQSAGRLNQTETAAYRAALDWVEAMRSACTTLIGAVDLDFATDAKWPPVPASVTALVARF